MVFDTSITVNVDAVTRETVANATGPALFQLVKQLSEEVLRLRAHRDRAQAALAEAHSAPECVQDTLGAEVGAARERIERLRPLANQALWKFVAEARDRFGHRRSQLAIEDLSGDEWDVLSTAASALDVDCWSLLEAGTEPESLSTDADGTYRSNSSFDLIDSADDATIGGSSSTEEERPAHTASRHRSATPMPRTQSSSARAQPHEFGEPTASSSRTASAAPRRHQDLGVPAGWENPAPTPWDPPSATVESAPVPSSAPARMRQQQRAVPSSTAAPPAPSSPPAPTATEALVDDLYDVLDYDNRIFGYVGGRPVIVVPEDIQIFSEEMLEALDKVIRWRRLEASMALVDAREQLKSADEDDAVMALALEISAHEAAIAKAERLARVSLYQQIQLSPDELDLEKREAQQRLIVAERLRLQAGGDPVYWSSRDEDEAYRCARGSRGYAIWHPASWSTERAPAPSARRPSSSSRASARARSRSRVRFEQSAPQSQPPSQAQPSSGATWTPRDDTSLAREQLHEKVRRCTLQRQGRWEGIPPCRTVHVSRFNENQNKATLQRLMRRHGFDVDEATEVLEYYVTHSRKGRGFHYYGFVTFKHLDAAVDCVRRLDRMDLDGHGGMTPIFVRRDGRAEHEVLTFSFSNNPHLTGGLLRQLDAGVGVGDNGRPSSSRVPPGRRPTRAATPGRRPTRAATPGRRPQNVPDYDTDSDETGLEDC